MHRSPFVGRNKQHLPATAFALPRRLLRWNKGKRILTLETGEELGGPTFQGQVKMKLGPDESEPRQINLSKLITLRRFSATTWHRMKAWYMLSVQLEVQNCVSWHSQALCFASRLHFLRHRERKFSALHATPSKKICLRTGQFLCQFLCCLTSDTYATCPFVLDTITFFDHCTQPI